MKVLAFMLVLASLGFSAKNLNRFPSIQLIQSSPGAMEAPVAAERACTAIKGSSFGLDYNKGLAAMTHMAIEESSNLWKTAKEGNEGARALREMAMLFCTIMSIIACAVTVYYSA